MNENQNEAVEIIEETPVRVSLPVWLIVLLVLIVAGVGYLLYATQVHYTELSQDLSDVNEQLALLESRASQLEDDTTALHGEMDEASKKLGLTQADIKKARALALQNREQQKQAAAQLRTEIDQKVGAVTTEVASVQGEVMEAKETIEETMSRLDRTMGDLGIQSGLIASNREELEALKVRGQRNYFDFEIQKSKRYTRVGDISIRLNKTDQKRQKYTITVLANDKRIEKKDKTLLEPVQFYQQGTRSLLEIVVFEISKNRVAGYMSAPKEIAERTAMN